MGEVVEDFLLVGEVVVDMAIFTRIVTVEEVPTEEVVVDGVEAEVTIGLMETSRNTKIWTTAIVVVPREVEMTSKMKVEMVNSIGIEAVEEISVMKEEEREEEDHMVEVVDSEEAVAVVAEDHGVGNSEEIIVEAVVPMEAVVHMEAVVATS